jgi:hypothetical protein
LPFQLTITQDGDSDVVGSAALSTLIGCATGGIVVSLVERFFPGLNVYKTSFLRRWQIS